MPGCKRGLSVNPCERTTFAPAPATNQTVYWSAANPACNFARMTGSALADRLKMNPAKESGIANHVWTLEEIAGLID